MKIANIELISFHYPSRRLPTRWGYIVADKGHDEVMTVTRITTDDGGEGYSIGGHDVHAYAPSKTEIENAARPLLVGENPLDRARLWQWMMKHRRFSEALIGNLDCALWDLLGRMAGVPVAKLLGGAREKVKAYASTWPNLGTPEEYAAHALQCKQRGYKAYKIHGYIHWDPYRQVPTPAMPAFPKEDVEICQAVRQAVGDEIVLMLDPWGVYTYEESLYVGREIQRLGFYWLEHPMDERRMEPYRRLCRELNIAVCSPELATGSYYSRAEWALQGASDIGRIDVNFGGITACQKALAVYEAFGIPCELHVGSFANIQLLGSTTEETCEYFERGLLRPDEDYDVTPAYLNSPRDPMDGEGYIHLSDRPGLGVDYNWDYIREHLANE
jgi:L-alanine-DL-glutamate epimerase-like enolase superfamily enzyme